MTGVPAFNITVYNKDFVREGWVGAPATLDVNLVQNGVGLAIFQVAADNDMIEPLMQPGARVVINYKGTDILSGPISKREGEGPLRRGVVTFTVKDDWSKLEDMLCWPQPTRAIGSQTVTHWRQNGPLETVFKNAVQANASRMGMPLQVSASAGRGPTYRAAIRFKTPAEEFAAALDAANLRSRVIQEGDHLVLHVDETHTWPLTLTEESGLLDQWNWTEEAPAATRVVLGAGGEDEDRFFRARTRTAREAEWGERIEVWRDARDISLDDPDRDALTGDRMDETLDEGGPKSGLSVRFQENEGFQFLEAYGVGDVVTVEVGPGVRISDRLREVTLSWRGANVETHSSIGDQVGSSENPSATLMRAVRAIYRRVRGSETSR